MQIHPIIWPQPELLHVPRYAQDAAAASAKPHSAAKHAIQKLKLILVGVELDTQPRCEHTIDCGSSLFFYHFHANKKREVRALISNRITQGKVFTMTL